MALSPLHADTQKGVQEYIRNGRFELLPLALHKSAADREIHTVRFVFYSLYSISVFFQSLNLLELGSTSALKGGTEHRAPGVTGE